MAAQLLKAWAETAMQWISYFEKRRFPSDTIFIEPPAERVTHLCKLVIAFAFAPAARRYKVVMHCCICKNDSAMH